MREGDKAGGDAGARKAGVRCVLTMRKAWPYLSEVGKKSALAEDSGDLLRRDRTGGLALRKKQVKGNPGRGGEGRTPATGRKLGTSSRTGRTGWLWEHKGRTCGRLVSRGQAASGAQRRGAAGSTQNLLQVEDRVIKWFQKKNKSLSAQSPSAGQGHFLTSKLQQ